MLKNSTFKRRLFASFALGLTSVPILLAASIVSNSPSLPDFGLEPVKLGLDLQGGSRIILQIDEEAVARKYKAEVASYFGDGVAYEAVKSGPNSIKLAGVLKGDRYNEVLRSFKTDYPDLTVIASSSDHPMVSGFKTSMIKRVAEAAKRNISVVNARLNALGASDVTVYKQGDSKLIVELPKGIDLSKAKKLLTSTSQIGMYLVNHDGRKTISYRGTNFRTDELPFISGEDIASAIAAQDPDSGQPIVSIRLLASSGTRVAWTTSNNIGGMIATTHTYQNGETESGKRNIVTDVISVASIGSAFGRDFKMTGLGSFEKCEELSMVLTSGVMDVPMDIIAEQVIDAKFGAKNVEIAFKAMALGLVALFAFIVFKYGLMGVVTCFTLLVSGSVLVLALSFYDAVFTLMGIAGLVLTLGIAVDMNVIVFEKAKEVHGNLKEAYESSFPAILDANVTTFIAAVLLFQIGSVQVKGFALVLGLGVVSSLLGSYLINKYLMTRVFHFNSTIKE